MLLWKIPTARSIDGRFLAAVLILPLAVAAIAAVGVVMTNPAEVLEGGPIQVAVDFAKLCYLAVGMAHLSRGLADRTDGGPAGIEWWFNTESSASGDLAADYWHRFPNHFDGAAIALALALLLAMY